MDSWALKHLGRCAEDIRFEYRNMFAAAAAAYAPAAAAVAAAIYSLNTFQAIMSLVPFSAARRPLQFLASVFINNTAIPGPAWVPAGEDVYPGGGVIYTRQTVSITVTVSHSSCTVCWVHAVRYSTHAFCIYWGNWLCVGVHQCMQNTYICRSTHTKTHVSARVATPLPSPGPFTSPIALPPLACTQMANCSFQGNRARSADGTVAAYGGSLNFYALDGQLQASVHVIEAMPTDDMSLSCSWPMMASARAWRPVETIVSI